MDGPTTGYLNGRIPTIDQRPGTFGRPPPAQEGAAMTQETSSEETHEKATAAMEQADSGSNHHAGVDGDDPSAADDANDSIDDVLNTMAEYQVRRLPVLESGTLVGVISEADIAREGNTEEVADTVQAVTSP